MAIGYLGIGSNVGDRLASLRAARTGLERRDVAVLDSSTVYETEPVGDLPDQAEFLNACLRVATDLDPDELLGVCKSLEREIGRAPGGARHGPRPIDIDLLLLGDREHRSDRLTLPHPEIRGRGFVLVPLLELEPALRLPGGTPLAPALDSLAGQRVVPFAAL